LIPTLKGRAKFNRRYAAKTKELPGFLEGRLFGQSPLSGAASPSFMLDPEQIQLSWIVTPVNYGRHCDDEVGRRG
jgi:hypothetical protein